jgi:hypothetical protein
MVIIKVTKPIWQQDGGCGGGGGGVVLFFISMPHNLALYFSVQYQIFFVRMTLNYYCKNVQGKASRKKLLNSPFDFSTEYQERFLQSQTHKPLSPGGGYIPSPPGGGGYISHHSRKPVADFVYPAPGTPEQTLLLALWSEAVVEK